MAASLETNYNVFDLDNYTKSTAGLDICCSVAASIIQHYMEAWHKQYCDLEDYQCTGAASSEACPSWKRPKPQLHCGGCVKWVDVIIDIAIDPKYIQWEMSEPSKFSESAVHIAKMFGLRIVAEEGRVNLKSFTDFDPAWVLTMMQGFKFFQNSTDVIEIVQTVRDHRNRLMHRPGELLPWEELQSHHWAYIKFIQTLHLHFSQLYNADAYKNTLVVLNEMKPDQVETFEDLQSSDNDLQTENGQEETHQAYSSMETPDRNYSKASIYVGNLHNDVTEAMLFEKFSSAGPILSLRVCRDRITCQSLGYAYVNFQQPRDAERALDTMNCDVLQGRPIRIMWPEHVQSLRRSGAASVFIKNLDKSIDNNTMYDTFSVFGNILECRVTCDEEGSTGNGCVHFETEDAAQKAIVNANGMCLNGKKVFVGRFKTNMDRLKQQFGIQQCNFTNVFIKNFDEELDDEKLQTMCEKFGTITSCKVMVDDKSGKSKRFGFASFESQEAAMKCIDELNNSEVNGRTIYAGLAQKKAERYAEQKARVKQERGNRHQRVNLYIKNLDDKIDDNKLRKAFSRFGTITSARVMTDEHGKSQGFGFVCFSSPKEATIAVTEMNGTTLVAKAAKRLYVTLAKRKEENKLQLTSQIMPRITNGMRNINVATQPAQQVSQIFPGGFTGYYAPTIFQAQAHRGHYAGQTPMLIPRWPQPGERPGTTPSFHTMPAGLRQFAAPRAVHSAPNWGPVCTLQPGRNVSVQPPPTSRNANAYALAQPAQQVSQTFPDGSTGPSPPIMFQAEAQRGLCAGQTPMSIPPWPQPGQRLAKRALQTMNLDGLQGRPMRITLSKRVQSGEASVYIKNLGKSIDNNVIYDTFSVFGNILECQVVFDEKDSERYGMVHFEIKEAAEKTIQRINGTVLNGKKVYVGKFIPQKEQLGDQECKFTNVYIKNFGQNLDDAKLQTMCEKFGKVTSCKVMLNDRSGKSKGFGFVSFESHEAAEKCVDELNNSEINGRTIYAGRAQKKAERLAEQKAHFQSFKEKRGNRFQKDNLYIKNMDDEIDDNKLRQAFGRFGTITSVAVMTDAKGKSKGFGFVCFSSPDEATEAVKEMNGRILLAKPLYVAIAQRKEERKLQIASQMMQRVTGETAGANQQAINVSGQEPLTAQMLAQVSQNEQKQMLGERLYPKIHRMHGDLSGKITDMLLEIDNVELLHMLESHDSLIEKVGCKKATQLHYVTSLP